MPMRSRGISPLTLIPLLIGLGGCGGSPDPGPAGSKPDGGTVVVYSALDEEFSKPILDAYGRSAGVEIRPKFDTESTKTVGLTNLLIAESTHPRCDLFWNNEILNTLRLREKGLLASFQPRHLGEIPDGYRGSDGTWYGFAARARILLVNTAEVGAKDMPTGLDDLLNPKWKGKVAIAKPLFGTTATHAACLFAAWGDEKATRFFRDLKANEVQVLSGNKQVAAAVGSGQFLFGLTDTDDAMGEINAGRPVTIVYPDRKPDQLGTLFIPNVVAVLKGAPHPEPARALADHLLSPEVEETLARGPSAQIPILLSSPGDARVETPRTVHPMAVDFEAAARIWDRVAAFLAGEFAGG